MMGIQYCDYSDLPEESCAHCKGLVVEPVSFRARFAGACTECDNAISPGDQIVLHDYGYAHQEHA